MAKLTSKGKEKIMELRSQFPRRLDISIHCCEEGGFAATINNLPGCITEGDTFSELIEMINDCVYTYFDIPQKYFSYMPTYLPPFAVAAGFDFPRCPCKKDIKANFKITSDFNEKIAVQC